MGGHGWSERPQRGARAGEEGIRSRREHGKPESGRSSRTAESIPTEGKYGSLEAEREAQRRERANERTGRPTDARRAGRAWSALWSEAVVGGVK